jgi:Ras family protein T1
LEIVNILLCLLNLTSLKAGVGKTSLITSFLREGFEPEVAHVLPEISIPGEVTADRVQTHIIDTSGSETDKQTVATELSLADVVCLVYSVSDASESDSCFRRLSTYWLPFIRNTTKGKLVLFLACFTQG